MVSKFRPMRFGNRKVLRSESQVPSPTYMVPEEYWLLPGGARLSVDIAGEVSGRARLEWGRVARKGSICMRANGQRLCHEAAVRCLYVQWRREMASTGTARLCGEQCTERKRKKVVTVVQELEKHRGRKSLKRSRGARCWTRR